MPELWTVDARVPELSFRIASLQKDRLIPVLPGEDGWTRSPLLDVAFRLERFRTDLATWDYTLASRAL